MSGEKNFGCKLSVLIFLAILNISLFFISLRVNYQWELAKEHVRFRKGFPSQANWIPSPFGRLKCYLFNVTNAAEFLNGTDTRMKMEQVGPITYSIKGFNKIFEQTSSYLTYEKIRYHEAAFEPLESGSPDILNQTIILPNLVLLGAAAKFHDWPFPVRYVFNGLTLYEEVFLKRSVYYFLWEFELPTLNVLSNYAPHIVSNCGMLYNALRPKEEIYRVTIGTDQGESNFFRVKALNNRTIFKERKDKEILFQQKAYEYCPINVTNSFDNSLFPPFLKPTDEIDIVAAESCRTLRMNYTNSVKHGIFTGYRYALSEKSDKPSCLEKSMGIKLHDGMFDVSKCLFNNVPSAFSKPHFYGSSYNWSEHFEGFNPNEYDHEPHIILEPITGIPVEERYRFQSNIPMPNLTGFRKELQRFSNIVVPSFWYEYDMDDLPVLIQLLIAANVYMAPILQPILTVSFCLFGLFYLLKAYFFWKGISIRELIEKRSGVALETTFEGDEVQNTIDLEDILK